MILLDTHAVIWIDQRPRRARPVMVAHEQLCLSPATLMELQMLVDIGRLATGPGFLDRVLADDRWNVDDPPAVQWFMNAAELTWTRDPFDRLIVAHARMRGWRLATADRALLAQLGPRERMEL